MLEHPRFAYLRHDIVEPLPPLPPIARVYHQASPASPPAYRRHPVETIRVNGEGTRRLLELAARDGARFALRQHLRGLRRPAGAPLARGVPRQRQPIWPATGPC